MKRAGTPANVSFPQSDWHGFPSPMAFTLPPSSDASVYVPDGRRVFRSTAKWADKVGANGISAPQRDAAGAPVLLPSRTPADGAGIGRAFGLPDAQPQHRRPLRVVEYVTQQPGTALEDLFGVPSPYDSLSLSAAGAGSSKDAALSRAVGQRTMYNAWGDAFDAEVRKGVSSPASLAELMYCAVVAQTNHPHPATTPSHGAASPGSPSGAGGSVDALRIAGAALILDKLLAASKARGEHVLTLSCSLLNLLKTELLNGVYVEHAVDVASPHTAKPTAGGGASGLRSPPSRGKTPFTSGEHPHGGRLSPLTTASGPATRGGAGGISAEAHTPCYIDMTLAKQRIVAVEEKMADLAHARQLTQLRQTSDTVLRSVNSSSTMLASVNSMPLLKSLNTLRGAAGSGMDASDDAHFYATSDPTPSDLIIRGKGAVWDVRSVAQLQGHCKRVNKMVERLVFRAWRSACHAGRRRSNALQAISMMVFHSSQSVAMRLAFRTWMSWARAQRNATAGPERMVADLSAAITARDATIMELRGDMKALRVHIHGLEHALETGGGGGGASPRKLRSTLSSTVASTLSPGASPVAEDLLSAKLKASADDTLERHRVNGRTVPVFQMVLVEDAATPTSPVGGVGGVSVPGDDAPLMGVERVDVSVFLVDWTNAVIRTTPYAKDVRLTTVEGGLVDGTVFVALMTFLFPTSNYEELMTCRSYSRVQRLIKGLEEQGLESGTITTGEITNAAVSNWCVMSWLFHCWYNAIQPILKAYDPALTGTFGFSKHHAIIGWCVRALRISRMFPQAFSTLDLRVTALVVRIMSRRLRAAYQTEAEGSADKAEFVTVKEAALSDIAEHLDVVAEIPSLVNLLNTKYDALFPIYEFYRDQSMVTLPTAGGSSSGAAGDDDDLDEDDDEGVEGMLLPSFLRFCSDCKLSQRTGLTNVFAVVSKHLEMPSATGNNKNAAAAGQLSKSDQIVISKGKFVELLVRLAAIHLMSANGVVGMFRRGDVAATLQELLTNNVFPYAMVSERKQFRRQVAEPRIGKCFAVPSVQRMISKIYRMYAVTMPPGVAGGGGAERGGGGRLSPPIMLMKAACQSMSGHADREEHRPQLSRDNFLQLLSDLKLIEKPGPGAMFTRNEAAGIFRGVQRDEEGVDDEGVTMNLNEFQDALVAVAMVKLPFPFQPLHVRVAKYLTDTFVPSAMARTGAKR